MPVAGFVFSNTNYENWNSNTNAIVSSQFAYDFFSSANRANSAKNNLSNRKAIVLPLDGNRLFKQREMKRHNHLYEKICSMDNLRKAELNARKKKQKQYGVRVFDRDKEGNLLRLHKMLADKAFRTSAYRTFKVYDPKEREVFCLPYFPDRIVHHAIMIPLEPIYNAMFTADTYSCIKGKGVTDASDSLKYALRDVAQTLYCLKLDVKKFYPSINHDILKSMHLRKFKDRDFIKIVFEIIDSASGIPIGNYLSQTFANFYMSPFDHWIKQDLKVVNYFRYMDDIVILAPSKAYLHEVLAKIRRYWQDELKLTIKKNYQIFPVASRGIDFAGYKHFHGYKFIRDSIKRRFIRMMIRRKNNESIQSYRGWFKHGDCKHLQKKYLPQYEVI